MICRDLPFLEDVGAFEEGRSQAEWMFWLRCIEEIFVIKTILFDALSYVEAHFCMDFGKLLPLEYVRSNFKKIKQNIESEEAIENQYFTPHIPSTSLEEITARLSRLDSSCESKDIFFYLEPELNAMKHADTLMSYGVVERIFYLELAKVAGIFTEKFVSHAEVCYITQGINKDKKMKDMQFGYTPYSISGYWGKLNISLFQIEERTNIPIAVLAKSLATIEDDSLPAVISTIDAVVEFVPMDMLSGDRKKIEILADMKGLLRNKCEQNNFYAVEKLTSALKYKPGDISKVFPGTLVDVRTAYEYFQSENIIKIQAKMMHSLCLINESTYNYLNCQAENLSEMAIEFVNQVAQYFEEKDARLLLVQMQIEINRNRDIGDRRRKIQVVLDVLKKKDIAMTASVLLTSLKRIGYQ